MHLRNYLPLTPFALYDLLFFDIRNLNTEALLAIIYYGLFGSIIAYFLWFDGVSRVKATTAGVFTSILPISTILLSFLILKETINWYHYIGVILVIIGIIINAFDEK